MERRNEELQLRLAEAEETLRAIREGEVDAVVVSGARGEQIFSLVGAESIYRLIVETMKEAAFTVSFDGTILFCNNQLGQFVRRPMEQIVGHLLQEFVTEDSRNTITGLLSNARNQSVTQRLVFQATDGTAAPAHISANVLNQPDGISICIVASDLTELENSTELILQLREQQEALRQSEERFRLAARATNDAIYDFDLANGTLQWNDTHAMLYGRLSGTADSWTWWINRIHPEDRKRVAGGLTSAIDRGELNWTDEYRFHRADGMWVHIYDRAYILRDQSGKAQRVIGAMQDQTERKRAELRLRALMNALPVGVSFSEDPSCRRITGNPAAMAQFEMKPEDNISASAGDADALGLKVRYFSNGRLITEAELPLQKAVSENREIAPMELEVVLPSGRRWITTTTGAPVRDELGNVVGGIAVTVDVTDRKKAEEQLRKAHEELEQKIRERTAELTRANRTLRMVSECNQALVRVTDEEELMREICRIVVEIGGYRMAWVGYAENDEEKTVRPVASIGFEEAYLKDACITWADSKRGRGPTGTCIRTGGICVGRSFLEDPGLEPWRAEALKRGYQSSIALPLMSGGTAFGALTIYADKPYAFDSEQTVLLRDLADDLTYGILMLRAQAERDQIRKTAEKRAEQLQALAAELVQAEQRERRRLAQILHDHLQQLLVGAKFGASIIRTKAKDEDIRQLADQLADALNEAIVASRSLSSDLSSPVLHEKGLRAGLEWLGRQMHQKHGLAVDVEAAVDAEPATEQIRVFLFEAIRELLLNIVKYAQVDRALVRMRKLESGEVEVLVADNGVGFDPAEFDSAASTTGGFGLFSIRERLNYLGGRMDVDAASGLGSKFTLVVPAHLASARVEAKPISSDMGSAATQQPAAAEEASPNIDRRIRILLVDDHPVMRQGLTRLLQEQRDIQVVGEAGDGQAAVALTRQLKPDMVLMDISMPGVNGFDATRQIVSESPGVQVIGLSMHEEADMAAAMRKAGAVAYLTKGGPGEHLIAVIRSVWAAKTLSKSESAGQS